MPRLALPVTRFSKIGVAVGARAIGSSATIRPRRVQAAVGIRGTKAVEARQSPTALREGAIAWASDTKAGKLLSSRLHHKLNDQFLLPNDSGDLTLDRSDVTADEPGQNFKMTGACARPASGTRPNISRNARSAPTVRWARRWAMVSDGIALTHWGGLRIALLSGMGKGVAGTAAAVAAHVSPKAWISRWAPDNGTRAPTEPAPSVNL